MNPETERYLSRVKLLMFSTPKKAKVGVIQELRSHIDNADSKFDGEFHKRRIVKRIATRKVDAAVALSQAHYECLRLNL